MYKITLFTIIHARNQITNLFKATWKTLSGNGDRGERKIPKLQQFFLKKGKYLEKKVFSKPIWFVVNVIFFSELKAFFANRFPKN